jgi:hypothetical protein
MKTQHQSKALVQKETVFGNERIAQQSKNDFDVLEFDGEVSFDTHWSYSYIMDYISSHKARKRKS